MGRRMRRRAGEHQRLQGWQADQHNGDGSDKGPYQNAINLGHSVLGLLALRDGNVSIAVEELHKAGATRLPSTEFLWPIYSTCEPLRMKEASLKLH